MRHAETRSQKRGWKVGPTDLPAVGSPRTPRNTRGVCGAQKGEGCPRATSPCPLTVSRLGQQQALFCEGLCTRPGTHKQADASLTRSGHPVPTLTAAVHIPGSRPRRSCCSTAWSTPAAVGVDTCARAGREGQSHGVCTQVFNAEGEGGEGRKRERQGSGDRPFSRWQRGSRKALCSLLPTVGLQTLYLLGGST